MTVEGYQDLKLSKYEARQYLRDVSDANLTYAAEKLVSEARRNRYSLRARTGFLLAVGAVAPLDYGGSPDATYEKVWYQFMAGSVIKELHAMDLIATCDSDMPYRDEDEWATGVRHAFDTVHLVY